MVNVKKIICGELGENCYIVYSKENNYALIIDPGDNYDEIIRFVNSNKLIVEAVLLTHSHFDHIQSCRKLQNLGYKIYVHEFDASKCSNNDLNMFNSFQIGEMEPFVPDIILFGGEEIAFNVTNVKVIHTPGHSAGSCCYVIENNLFSGDTLFKNGFGRVDFYDGSLIEMRRSIKTLKEYTGSSFTLFDGHN